jgi:glyoxylase-like metal-dependent hydrolase (beta-lactamase superfamily II)
VTLRVHHLNAGQMEPRPAALVFGRGAHLRHMVCHVLLIETDAGLVLVDSGIGRADIAAPSERLGSTFVRIARPCLHTRFTAANQIEAMGHRLTDVRHVIATHMDLDHIGGLADFPHARVHVLGTELEHALARPTIHDRARYRPAQWAHGPRWEPAQLEDGEDWLGFRAVRDLAGLPPEILLVPLHGHSRGHVGVAIDTGGSWLLHCGDAYFHRHEVEKDPPACTPGLALFQRLAAFDNRARLHNRARLGELARAHATGDGRVRLFSAHDPVELERCVQGA